MKTTFFILITAMFPTGSLYGSECLNKTQDVTLETIEHIALSIETFELAKDEVYTMMVSDRSGRSTGKIHIVQPTDYARNIWFRQNSRDPKTKQFMADFADFQNDVIGFSRKKLVQAAFEVSDKIPDIFKDASLSRVDIGQIPVLHTLENIEKESFLDRLANQELIARQLVKYGVGRSRFNRDTFRQGKNGEKIEISAGYSLEASRLYERSHRILHDMVRLRDVPFHRQSERSIRGGKIRDSFAKLIKSDLSFFSKFEKIILRLAHSMAMTKIAPIKTGYWETGIVVELQKNSQLTLVEKSVALQKAYNEAMAYSLDRIKNFLVYGNKKEIRELIRLNMSESDVITLSLAIERAAKKLESIRRDMKERILLKNKISELILEFPPESVNLIMETYGLTEAKAIEFMVQRALKKIGQYRVTKAPTKIEAGMYTSILKKMPIILDNLRSFKPLGSLDILKDALYGNIDIIPYQLPGEMGKVENKAMLTDTFGSDEIANIAFKYLSREHDIHVMRSSDNGAHMGLVAVHRKSGETSVYLDKTASSSEIEILMISRIKQYLLLKIQLAGDLNDLSIKKKKQIKANLDKRLEEINEGRTERRRVFDQLQQTINAFKSP